MASSPQHEPTMEEILASIRKIISEDSTEPAPASAPVAVAAPAPEATPAPAAAALEEDVLELTQEVKEEPMSPPPPEDITFKEVEEPAPVAAASNEIFSDKTRKAMDDAFAELDAEDEPAAPPPAAPSVRTAVDGNSVEAVFERAVRDAVGPHIDQWMAAQKSDLLAAMKPLIREWMDEHFPAILEGAVRDEVARAVKARGKR